LKEQEWGESLMALKAYMSDLLVTCGLSSSSGVGM
jgi:hypothetical protein